MHVIVQQKGVKFLLTTESVQSLPPFSYHKKGMFPLLQGTIKLKAVSRLLGRTCPLEGHSAHEVSPACGHISTFPIMAALTLQKNMRPFTYDLNHIPYDYTVEVTNRFKGLDLIECLNNYEQRFVTLYRRQ